MTRSSENKYQLLAQNDEPAPPKMVSDSSNIEHSEESELENLGSQVGHATLTSSSKEDSNSDGDALQPVKKRKLLSTDS